MLDIYYHCESMVLHWFCTRKR